VGAYIGEESWEGWTATLAPASPPPWVEVGPICRPRWPAATKICYEQVDATVYVMVKDAWLQTADMPGSWRAGQIKGHVQQVDELQALRPHVLLAPARAGHGPPWPGSTRTAWAT